MRALSECVLAPPPFAEGLALESGRGALMVAALAHARAPAAAAMAAAAGAGEDDVDIDVGERHA